MLSVKNILAGLLLMVYAISFGHSVIPQHHHLNEHGEHVEDTHCESETPDHQHISHDDHFDEGILDFLGCLIEHLHHELPADHHENERNTVSTQKVTPAHLTVNFIAPVQKKEATVLLSKSIPIFTLFIDCQQDDHLVSHHLRRGPPNK